MKRNATIWVAALVCVAAAWTLTARAEDKDDGDEKGEEKIEFSALPEAVQKAARAALGDSKSFEAEKETKGKKVFYEVETKRDGKEIGAKFTEAGDLLEVERELAPGDLPQSVKDAIAKKYADSKIDESETVELRLYEVELKVGGKEVELLVDAAGKFHK